MTDHVRFMTCFQTILEDEGGWKFTDDPNDPGGMTYGGMTWNKFDGYCQDVEVSYFAAEFRQWAIENDPSLQAGITECYRKEFWDKAKCGELPLGIDELFFSMVVNLGIRQGTKVLQRGIKSWAMDHIVIDGIMGPQTIKMVAKVNDESTNLSGLIINAWEDKYLNLVVANAEAWRDWGMAHEGSVLPPRIGKPETFRAKYLRGWINRTRKYESRYT